MSTSSVRCVMRMLNISTPEREIQYSILNVRGSSLCSLGDGRFHQDDGEALAFIEGQSALLTELSAYKQHVGVFGKESVRHHAKVAPTHKWWEMCGATAPHLQRVAMRVSTQSSSACACERWWSTYSLIYRPIPNRLDPA